MKMVGGQLFDDLGNLNNEVIGAAVFHQAFDDGVIIIALVKPVLVLLKQFFHNIGKILGKGFSHFGAGVFGRRGAAHLYQSVNGQIIPVVQIFTRLFFFNQFKFFFGIVD